MRRSMPTLGVICLLCSLFLPGATAQAAPTAPGQLVAYFPQTGHNVITTFKKFFDAYGGVAVVGLPLTEAFLEDGLQVQYFERARFEYHPEQPANQRIQLTQIGRWFTNGREAELPFQWLGENPDQSGQRQFFAESGHSIGGAFLSYWQNRGGVPVLGFPLSEEFTETSRFDGQTYTVQYFERARFEYHPEKAGTPDEVQFGMLGRELLNQRPTAGAQAAPAKPLSLLGKATTGFSTSSDAREANIYRSAAMFNGVVIPAGAEYSFLNSGDFNDANLVEGYGIIGGRLEKVIGGGLCQVSTTMYRAVSNAGLPVTRRTGHTFVVYFYENILGFDATVFSPSVDFRWRNDTSGPVTIFTASDPAKLTVTFELYGTTDGRKTTYQGPVITNKRNPGTPIWQFDASLPRGAVQQMVHGRPGMDVNLRRIVTMPNGSVHLNEDVATHYDPWADFYSYGPGVTPPRGVVIAAPAPVSATTASVR